MQANGESSGRASLVGIKGQGRLDQMEMTDKIRKQDPGPRRSEEQRQTEYRTMIDAIRKYYDPLHDLDVTLECQTCDWRDKLFIINVKTDKWNGHAMTAVNGKPRLFQAEVRICRNCGAIDRDFQSLCHNCHHSIEQVLMREIPRKRKE